MIGMAHTAQGYPLYYEGVNEEGLGIAGLNFPHSARYHTFKPGYENITPYELIPWILGQCASLREAKALLGRVNLLDEAFSPEFPLTPLHWMLADREGAAVLEGDEEGVHVYENPLGVLTNEPPFPEQMKNWERYYTLTPEEKVEHPESRGLGALGLPGDLSSQSRFVRCAYVAQNSVSGETEEEQVSQFFHILTSVEQQIGCVRLVDRRCERTLYSCCCNTRNGIYYYTTYENRGITATALHGEDLEGKELISYPLLREPEIHWQNG